MGFFASGRFSAPRFHRPLIRYLQATWNAMRFPRSASMETDREAPGAIPLQPVASSVRKPTASAITWPFATSLATTTERISENTPINRHSPPWVCWLMVIIAERLARSDERGPQPCIGKLPDITFVFQPPVFDMPLHMMGIHRIGRETDAILGHQLPLAVALVHPTIGNHAPGFAHMQLPWPMPMIRDLPCSHEMASGSQDCLSSAGYPEGGGIAAIGRIGHFTGGSRFRAWQAARVRHPKALSP